MIFCIQAYLPFSQKKEVENLDIHLVLTTAWSMSGIGANISFACVLKLFVLLFFILECALLSHFFAFDKVAAVHCTQLMFIAKGAVFG